MGVPVKVDPRFIIFRILAIMDDLRAELGVQISHNQTVVMVEGQGEMVPAYTVDVGQHEVRIGAASCHQALPCLGRVAECEFQTGLVPESLL